MPHGDHSHLDLEAALAGEMPPPYCESAWRRDVTLLGVTAALVLGLSMRSFLAGGDAGRSMGSVAMERPLPGPSMGAEFSASPDSVVQVAGIARGSAATFETQADANVRFVGTAERTTFNVAARQIRPSVVSVRAALPPTVAGPAAERGGSGIIVDSSGHVVTCRHVVDGSVDVVVTPFRQPDVQIPARVVAVEDDLALLQVGADLGRPAARIGNSDRVRVGDWVLAVGHPFGLGLTVTAGIVGRKRGALAVPGGPPYTGLLQTDAPINEGSSGGPLVNMAGDVIGVNTAIYAPTGVFSGAGFAIPADRLQGFLQRNGVVFASGSATVGATPVG